MKRRKVYRVLVHGTEFFCSPCELSANWSGVVVKPGYKKL
jgi:hypothetical protein